MLSNFDSTTVGFVLMAVSASYFLTAVAKVVARRTGMLDHPDGRRKAQSAPVPLLGGVAVYLSLLGTVVVAAEFYHWKWLNAEGDQGRFVLMLLISAGLFCALGLWDDRVSLRPRTKLALQVLACLPFVIWGRSVESLHLFDARIGMGLLGSIFTVFWLVSCSNVINLVDGLDGLAGTIGLIVCAAVAGLCDMQGLFGPLALSLVFAGALFGFLLHNWPPASIYLGDSGSLTIGFVIGALAIESSMKKATGFALAIPLVLVSVPVFDTCMAILRRKLNGRGIGEADRGHIHHCLQNRGLSRAQSLLVISALCVAMAAVTLVSAYFQNDRLALGLCLALLALLIVGRVFGYDETVLFFRYIQAMSTLLAGTSGVFKTQLVVDRIARSHGVEPIRYWQEITEHVDAMGGTHLDFVCWDERSDAVICRLHWAREAQEAREQPELPELGAADREPAWQFNYSVPSTHGIRATLTSRGSLQNRLKGQRLIDLFRLFDTFCHSWTQIAVPLPTAEVAADALPEFDQGEAQPTILPLPTAGARGGESPRFETPAKVVPRRAA
jgi:UDP-N-acetylmuramyl pentapeptide phosphotransferase/UDP-N-acetylglucosamine-1-phosphate transferase